MRRADSDEIADIVLGGNKGRDIDGMSFAPTRSCTIAYQF